jgi:hypothetical protein
MAQAYSIIVDSRMTPIQVLKRQLWTGQRKACRALVELLRETYSINLAIMITSDSGREAKVLGDAQRGS